MTAPAKAGDPVGERTGSADRPPAAPPRERVCAMREPGSFRDPAGHVFVVGSEVIRTVHPCAAGAFEHVLASGILDALAQRGLMIDTAPVRGAGHQSSEFQGARGETPVYLLRHPTLPFISYAHEWTFAQLKDAALCHLDMQLAAMEYGLTLSDASSHNIQFHKGRPLHIDPLSLRPYTDGEPWTGYHQFCRMFLLPLLLEAWSGVGFQPFLRGGVEGIPLDAAAQLLPRHRVLLSLNGFLHVHLHARLSGAATSSQRAHRTASATRAMPRNRYLALLQELRRWIASLQSRRGLAGHGSYWREYATVNSYSPRMQQAKAGFVAAFARRLCANRGQIHNPPAPLICDIGGNTGEYAQVALDAGAAGAMVLDTDLDSLERAYAHAKAGARLLPLCIDVADPSPSMGWNQCERKGLIERRSAFGGLLALAVIHHLCIGRNLPLREVVHWLVDFAPEGVIEFVPKSDPMVVGMLAAREDVFGDYDEATFVRCVQEAGEITDSLRLEDNGRLLVSYRRRRDG